MCLTVIGRVVALEPDGARVKVGDRFRQVPTLLVPDVAVGDDVLLSGSFIVARLSPEEAAERRQLFDQLLALAKDSPPAEGRPRGLWTDEH